MKNKMKKKSTLIIAVIILVAITLTGTTVGIHNFKKEVSQNEDVNIENAEENKYETNKETINEKDEVNDSVEINPKKPVFIYFVSNDDMEYDEAIKVFNELKKEYDDKVDFELKNVTENPEILENFKLVEGNTPALIMDGKEEITGIKLKTKDKEILKEEIEKSLR